MKDTEMVTLLVLGIVAVGAMLLLESGGKEIALTVTSGLVGYLSKTIKLK